MTEIKNKTKIKIKTKTKTSTYSYMLRAVLALRLREPKIQKSKTSVRGPKLLDFLVFLGFFGFPTEIPKKHMVFFWFSNRNQKTQGFWVFNQRPNKKQKKPWVFLAFHLKSKKPL